MALGLVWLAGALFLKRTARIEPPDARAGHVLTMAIAFTMLFIPERLWTPLAGRAIPPSTLAPAGGLALTVLGTAFAAWARLRLGANWSAAIALKEGHTLVRSGPYALARHPIYGGLVAAMLGSAIAFGHIAGFIAAIVAFAAFLAKARGEESLLLAEFGEEYAKYAHCVKTIIPFVF
jgi:protein-S-isoprenylcysteine O-methyltransferase Ste14